MIDVFVPVYNEGENIESLFEEFKKKSNRNLKF